jgi:LacI family transcriptional regulator
VTRRRRATLSQVAELAGVSPTTASLVLNRKPINVPAGTRQRVVAAAAQLHYVPNALVRSLQAGQTGTLGVYLEFRASVWHNEFVGALVDGLRSGAAASDCDVLLYRPPPAGAPATAPAPGPGDGAPPALGPAAILDARADAAVLWVTHPSSLEGLARQHFPAVVLLQEGVPAPLGSVHVDERRASRLVVEHLLALGHRRLAYYATSDAAHVFEHLRARRDAFLAEARAAGAPVAPADVLAGPPAVAAACLARIARRAPGAPTAIVCAHGELAFEVLELADRTGLGVPRELSVVSWEIVGAQERAGRAITGVQIPIWEMGKAAAELAATLSRREVPPGARHLTFAPALQVGSSSGPPPPAARP